MSLVSVHFTLALVKWFPLLVSHVHITLIDFRTIHYWMKASSWMAFQHSWQTQEKDNHPRFFSIFFFYWNALTLISWQRAENSANAASHQTQTPTTLTSSKHHLSSSSFTSYVQLQSLMDTQRRLVTIITFAEQRIVLKVYAVSAKNRSVPPV